MTWHDLNKEIFSWCPYKRFPILLLHIPPQNFKTVQKTNLTNVVIDKPSADPAYKISNSEIVRVLKTSNCNLSLLETRF